MTERTKQWMDRNPELVQEGPETGTLLSEEMAELKVGRRTFLAGLGISGVIGLSACNRLPLRQAIPYLVPPEHVVPGVRTPYASTCDGCPAACGVLVQCRDGRPIKVEGLPGHPLSKGGLCAAGHAELRGLYDAGRLREPTIDASTATWEEVDQAVTRGLRNLGGKPLAVVTGVSAGPAVSAAVEGLLKSYRGVHLRVAMPDDAQGAVAAAYQRLTGEARVPPVRLDGLRLLVTLGGDLLGTGESPVARTVEYSSGRGDSARMRHVAIEGRLSLTGAAADERHTATAYERFQYLAALALELRTLGARELDVLSGMSPKVGSAGPWIAQLARDLWSHRGRALVQSGSTDESEQALVALINRALGKDSVNEGGGLGSGTLPFASRADTAALMSGLKDGRFGGVIFLGVNPAEQLPGGDELSSHVENLPLSVAITDRPHGTAARCKVVAAAHHSMERWFDAEPVHGVHSVGQPTVRALFNTRDPLESLLRWAGASITDARAFVAGQWEKRHGLGSWQRAVARGGAWGHAGEPTPDELAGPAAPDEANSDDEVKNKGTGEAVAAALAQGALDSEPWSARRRQDVAQELGRKLREAAPSVEVELIREVGLLTGRNAANPWVRELPDPLTRVSWQGVACVAPSRADAMGISDGDVLSIKVGDVEARLPARIQPGVHADVVAVPVGYGLRDGDGGEKERNGFRLAVAGPKGAWVTAGLPAQLSRTAHRESLPIVQPHPSAEGRPIVHQVPSSEAAVVNEHHGGGGVHGGSLWSDHDYDEVHWEMVIDLDKCTGCGACVLSCQSENNLPVVGPEQMAMHRDMSWLRIDRYFEGDEDEPDVLFEPMLCAQCDNAPCETVCPVAATVHSSDGLNLQAYNRCVGTRYCANNCPYKTRRFNWLDYTPKDPIERLALNPDVVVRERGVMEKCTFCIQRIQRTRIEAKKAGTPMPDPVTACQQSCPATAIHFGNGAKPEPGMVALKEAKRAFQVLGELGIRPSITYLARIRPTRGGS